jgi:putative Mn2+ efflux pump MntP
MATLGMLVGRMLGPLIGRVAEILGGVTLITIGTHILIDHLGL